MKSNVVIFFTSLRVKYVFSGSYKVPIYQTVCSYNEIVSILPISEYFSRKKSEKNDLNTVIISLSNLSFPMNLQY